VEGEPVNPIAQRRPNRQLLRWTCAVACTLLMLAPLVAMAVASVSPHRVMVREKLALSPTVWSLENYRRVLRDSTFVGSVANSSKVALTVTLLAVPLAFAGGYALARYRSRGTRLVGLALLASQMLPAIMLAIPLYVLLAKLRLIDTHTALIIAYTPSRCHSPPGCCAGFFEGIPREIEECALVDGCSRQRMLWRIVLPISLPGLAAAAILVFLLAWNEYLFAMLLIPFRKSQDVPGHADHLYLALAGGLCRSGRGQRDRVRPGGDGVSAAPAVSGQRDDRGRGEGMRP
jgi:multiple sugar transport system permease protein